jgi:hypothetical protein
MEYLPDVPVAAGERQTLLALLDLQRASVQAICAGCSDDDLRTRLVQVLDFYAAECQLSR